MGLLVIYRAIRIETRRLFTADFIQNNTQAGSRRMNKHRVAFHTHRFNHTQRRQRINKRRSGCIRCRITARELFLIVS